MSFFDRYYSVLEIHAGCSHDEVKQAYRRLAKIYHPDRSGDPATRTKFIEITEAYQAILQKDKLMEAALLRYMNRKKGQATNRPSDTIRKTSAAYADMKFSAFEKTPIYSIAKAVNWLSTAVFIVVGILMVIGPFFGYYLQLYYPEHPDTTPEFEFLPIFIGLAFLYGLWYFLVKNASNK